MTDYNMTRDAAAMITDRFSDMLRRLQDDYEDEIVAVSLMKYHYLAKDNGDEDLMQAIDRVLQDYMAATDYLRWRREVNLSDLAKADQEDGLI